MNNLISKTLFISTYFPPQIGGAENYLFNIYSRIEPGKIFVLAQKKDEVTEKIFDDNQKFEIKRTDFFSGRFKPSWWPLKKIISSLIKKENIQTIHFGHYAHYVFIARFLSLPYLVYFHGTDLNNYSKSFWGRVIMRYNLKKADKIIVSSEFLKNKLLKIFNQPEKIIIVYPNINLSEFDIKLSKEDILKELNISLENKVFISSGHLIYDKGFDLGILAVSELIKQGHKIKYFILGNGDQREALKKLIHDLDLGENVFLTGEIKSRHEYAKYFKIADIYLGPSRNEGFGISFLEARANGLPIVASRVGGIPESAGEAVFFEKDNLEDLIEKIKANINISRGEALNQMSWDEGLPNIIKVLYND